MKKFIGLLIALMMIVCTLPTFVLADDMPEHSQVVFYNAQDDVVITSLNDMESIYAEVTFTMADNGSASVIAASFDKNDRLLDIEFLRGIQGDANETITYETPEISVDDAAVIRVFAFSGMDSLMPLLNNVGFIETVVELPTATVEELDVTEIEDVVLSSALNFKADEVTEKQLETYGDWYTDFVLTVNKDVTLNANGEADGYLSGQYDSWSQSWVTVPFSDVKLGAGEAFKIMETASKLLGKPGLKYTYKEVYEVVKDFNCGIYFDAAFIKANPGLKATLELRMYNPANEEEYITIGEVNEFDYTLPTATVEELDVTEIEDVVLSSALNFKADEVTEKQLETYGNWYTDFVLTVNKDVTLNANGEADGYLSGQYDSWSDLWVTVPFSDVELGAGEAFKIMETASKLLGKPGLKYTYEEVYEVVKDFDCGIYFDADFIKANPGLKATLELRMYNPANEEEYITIGEVNEFDYTLPTATVEELDVTEIEDVVLSSALNFKADEVTEKQLETYGNWYTDFVLTVNKDVTLNANGEADGYLSGQYDSWSQSWVTVPFSDVKLGAGEAFKIMETASKLLGKPGLKYTYKEVYEVVKDFNCGIYFDAAFIKANPGLKATLELRMYNPANEEEYITIGEVNEFEFESPISDKFVAKENLSFSKKSEPIEIKLGEIFEAIDEIDSENVTVTADESVIFTKNAEDWTQSTVTFTTTGEFVITINDNSLCNDATATVVIAESIPSVKFETKFVNQDKYVYRVGNNNAVSLNSLFKTINDEVEVGNVAVVIEEANENTNVSGEYIANAKNWENGTIQFAGTGPVKVTIQDDDYCLPTELYLEVVDAVNATAATDATKNNVVLLNNCGFSSIDVSGGYTLYGNGFTMTCASDSPALDTGYSFVTLNNGTLDNVQIVCPNFDYAALYKSNLTGSENRSETDSSGRTRYYNAKSGVMVTGNCQILNSRISGGRAALNIAGGNVVVDNSQIELGAVATILVGNANNVVLRDTTLVQKATPSTYDSNKTLMGFSVLYLCDSEGKAAPTTIEGSFVQQAWIDEDDEKYVPSAGESIVSTVMKETDFLHDIDGDGINESLNLGFAYMPEEILSSIAKPENITDNRTDEDIIPYEMKDIKVGVSILSTTVYVYSYKNTNGTADSFKAETKYEPNKNCDIITVNYSDMAEGLSHEKSYGIDGWTYELNVDLDKASEYAIDFNKLSLSVNGILVNDYKVNGSDKPTSPVAVAAGGTDYTLTATIDGVEYTATYKVTGTETTKESPSLVASNYEAGLCVASSYGGTWHGAAPALEGVQIKYWSVAEKQYKTINLSDYTPTTPGKLNGTNITWTFSPANGDFTLTLTGGLVHSGNSIYAMPVVCDGKLYFVASASKGLVNTGNTARTIPVSYVFEDNNGGAPLKFSHTWSVAENQAEQYKYSDFCNGTLTKLEKGGSNPCFTPDTLVTLADGTEKRIDQVTYEDQLLVWDFYKGEYAVVPPAVIVNHGEDYNTIITLNFDDGTDIKVVGMHGFFDAESNEWVYIDEMNVESYLGNEFIKSDIDTYQTVKLVDYSISKEYVEAYSIFTALYYNCFVEDILSLTPSMFDGENYYVPFEFEEGLKYDEVKMQADIEKYGLYTYEDFADFVTYEQFVAFNAPYLKVSVGKGMVTYEQLLESIESYVN